jgi:hypothetical protein
MNWSRLAADGGVMCSPPMTLRTTRERAGRCNARGAHTGGDIVVEVSGRGAYEIRPEPLAEQVARDL